MSHSSPRYTEIERPARVQEALNTIGSWMLGSVSVEPGWNELVLDIKPLSDTIFVRITESRDDQDYVGTVGPVKSDSPVLAAIEQLQHASFVEGEGTWFTASVVITATGWPTPSYQIGASYDRAHEPVDWNGEGRLSARDIRTHFETFPRDEQFIPEWASVRLAGRRGAGFDQQVGEGLPVGSVNRFLTEALNGFAAAPSEQALANVVRTAQGGNLIMDISQSTVGPEGKTVRNYQVLRLQNGMRALTAYSSVDYAENYSQTVLSRGNPDLVVEHAMKVFLQVAHDSSIDVLVLDPGSEHECFVEKAQIQWVIGSPHNMPAQRALVEENMHNLLVALTAPASTLLLGVRAGDTAGRPVMIKKDDESGENLALVFTSVAEVAALDPTLEVRSAPALDVLKLLAAGESPAVRINALAPHATMPMDQVRQLLSVIESQ
ncbi:SseB family protein [Rothia nasisuis]|uniref:SseB family protein n=1 Tax=Rothia nasisuis TaxID=2109647 RepID=UPI001F23BA92|nr:SseB family protein [Rothia nasisuis]